MTPELHSCLPPELQTTLALYLTTYNRHIPQRALNHQTPIQAL